MEAEAPPLELAGDAGEFVAEPRILRTQDVVVGRRGDPVGALERLEVGPQPLARAIVEPVRGVHDDGEVVEQRVVHDRGGTAGEILAVCERLGLGFQFIEVRNPRADARLDRSEGQVAPPL